MENIFVDKLFLENLLLENLLLDSLVTHRLTGQNRSFKRSFDRKFLKKNILYPYTAERRDVLGNTSPEDREIS